MISVHDRVDAILKHIDPAWLVVDFGSGDQYLKKCHPNTINIDKFFAPGVDMVFDLDWEYPEVQADCAVLSGILEWMFFPASFLMAVLAKYPNIILSYANSNADVTWQYETTIGEIEALLAECGRSYTTEAWDGQTIFVITKI